MDTSEDLKPSPISQSTQPITNGHSLGTQIEKKTLNEHSTSTPPFQPHNDHIQPHPGEPPHRGNTNVILTFQ